MVEDENMKLYCGKRCDKVDAKKRHNNLQEYSSFIDNDSDERQKINIYREKKREAKRKEKKYKESNLCRNRTMSYQFIGCGVEVFDNMYTICPIYC